MGMAACLFFALLALLPHPVRCGPDDDPLYSDPWDQHKWFERRLYDMDAMLEYAPMGGDGGPGTQWRNAYSLSAEPSVGTNVFGRGKSYHYTSAPGANVTLGFYGSDIYVYGSWSEGAQYDLIFDGQPFDYTQTLEYGLVAYTAGAPQYGYHTATLSLRSGSLNITSAIVRTWLYFDATAAGVEAPLANDAKLAGTQVWMAIKEGQANGFFQTSGTWTPATTVGGDADTPLKEDYPHLIGSEGASVSMTLPAGSSFFQLNGTSQSSPATYTVTIDPPPVRGGPRSRTLSAQRSFTNNVNYYFLPLDPTKQYTVNVTCESGTIGLYSVMTRSAIQTGNSIDGDVAASAVDGGDTGTAGNGGAGGGAVGTSTGTNDDLSGTGGRGGSGADNGRGSSKAPIGAIVGGVVGGVAVLLLAAGLWYFLRRRKRQHQHQMRINDEPVGTMISFTRPSPPMSPFVDRQFDKAIEAGLVTDMPLSPDRAAARDIPPLTLPPTAALSSGSTLTTPSTLTSGTPVSGTQDTHIAALAAAAEALSQAQRAMRAAARLHSQTSPRSRSHSRSSEASPRSRSHSHSHSQPSPRLGSHSHSQLSPRGGSHTPSSLSSAAPRGGGTHALSSDDGTFGFASFQTPSSSSSLRYPPPLSDSEGTFGSGMSTTSSIMSPTTGLSTQGSRDPLMGQYTPLRSPASPHSPHSHSEVLTDAASYHTAAPATPATPSTPTRHRHRAGPSTRRASQPERRRSEPERRASEPEASSSSQPKPERQPRHQSPRRPRRSAPSSHTRPHMPDYDVDVRQESDQGRLVAVVPPQYDPAWFDDFEAGSPQSDASDAGLHAL